MESAAQREAVLADVEGIESRLEALLQRTPPNGPEYGGFLKSVVSQEAIWTNWKDNTKCKPYERYPADPAVATAATATSTAAAAATSGSKKGSGAKQVKLGGGGGGAKSAKKRTRSSVLRKPPPLVKPTGGPPSASGSEAPDSVVLEGGGETIGKRLRTPTLEKHMEWYIDCEVRCKIGMVALITMSVAWRSVPPPIPWLWLLRFFLL